MTLTVTLDDRALQQALGRLQEAATRMQPVLDQIGMALAARVRSTFENESDPWGRAWPGLKPGTLRRRRMKGAGAKILRDTGVLANSISHTATDTSVEVSTRVKYAAIHQAGGTIQRKGRPGRVRLRTTAGGHLMRQPGRGNLAVFARATHKRAVERSYSGRDYSIAIPARPFFPIRGDRTDLPQAWRDEGVGFVLERLRRAVE